jgi:UDP-N-acetylmuramoylalanine--D-glutamate ligase
VRALVGGLGVSGFAAADTLQHLGATVVAVDDAEAAGGLAERATLLEALDVEVRLGAGATAPESIDLGAFDLVVTSPGWSPTTPLLIASQAAGLPLWGEVELAWRLRGEAAAPWLAVTGTNGKTTTVQMLDAMLRAGGLRSAAVGNVGRPVIEAVMDDQGHDVLAVELSSYQLHWSRSLACESSAVLNVTPDHLDWHGTAEDYAADKGRIFNGVRTACVYNVEDPLTEQLVRDADVVEGARAVGFTLGVPAPGMLGVVDDVLADRAFVADSQWNAAELCRLSDLGFGDSPPPHIAANALAAAALARSFGVSQKAVRDALRGFTPDAHRLTDAGTIGGVRYIDDSKATNPAAALAALLGYERVVWIAGGLAKGATFEDLVRSAGDRIAAAVLMGTDRALIAAALERHAPQVRILEVADGETEPMDRAVNLAASLAQPGDVVLLAPGCASLDQFANYAARGDAFAAAVRRLGAS